MTFGRVASFPRWRNLNHFSTIIHITFSDGNKMQDLSKVRIMRLLAF